MFGTLYELLEFHSSQRAESPAVLAEQRPPLTYQLLFRQVAVAIADLRSIGVCPHDRVATLESEVAIRKDREKMAPLFENRIWLWSIMALMIGVLGFFTLRMMKGKG
jgi:hypothetical protein